MPAGQYSVVRYVPDPVRDEPINIGIIATGPAGAVFVSDDAAFERMRIVDPFLDADTIPHIQDYIDRLVREPVTRVAERTVETIDPWMPGFLDSLRDRFPERFVLGRLLYIEYADESREAMADAAADLADRLVKPVTRKPAFPRDTGVPFERLKKLLRTAIKADRVQVRPAIQGFTRRVRHPDFFYRDRDGNGVIIVTVKLTQRRSQTLSQVADAKAFELLDMKQQQQARAIAVVEQPESPSPETLDVMQSIMAIADEVIDPRNGITDLVSRVHQQLELVSA
jgi:hypothetical protein